MTPNKLKNLIKKGESETVEFKTSLAELDRGIQELSSMADAKGGTVIFGVKDNGEIIGIETNQTVLEKISNKITGNIDPVIYPEIEAIEIGDKKVLAVSIAKNNNAPHLAFDRPYKRVGASTFKMKRTEYERLLRERKDVSFDEEPCKATLKDIDTNKVKWFLKKARQERKLDIDPKIPVKEALEKLNLYKNNQLTNGAILLFGLNPQKFFVQTEIRCARFKGIKETDPFIDMKTIKGLIFDQIDQAEKFILNYIKLSAWIEPSKLERQEKWEYPPDALREAITNAAAHRDYSMKASIYVSIFDDRIEVWSPGNLPKPLTPEDLKGKHKSILRNPIIADCLFLVKYIEKWGTGTNKIISECIKQNLPEPDFEEKAGNFVITFWKSKLTEDFLETLELNDRQKKAIEYLKEKKKIKSQEYADLFGVSERMARNDLKALIEKKILQRSGTSDKTAKYILAEI